MFKEITAKNPPQINKHQTIDLRRLKNINPDKLNTHTHHIQTAEKQCLKKNLKQSGERKDTLHMREQK